MLFAADQVLAKRKNQNAFARYVFGCRVDWTRRFDHMQQHTGQHVLSAAFDSLLGARTESFHLGADYATIDLARELTPQEIAAELSKLFGCGISYRA